MDQYNMVYTFNRIFFNHKKKEKAIYATIWINLEDIILCKINQPPKDKYCVIPLTWIVVRLLKEVKFAETKNRMELIRSRGRGEWEVSVYRSQSFSGRRRNILKTDGGDCSTTWAFFMPTERCTENGLKFYFYIIHILWVKCNSSIKTEYILQSLLVIMYIFAQI